MKLSGLLGESESLTMSAVPSLNRLSSVCKRVHDRWPDVMPAPQGDRESIAREMLGRVQGNDWEKATLASVIRAGRVAFEPEFRNLRGLRRLRNFYFQEVKASTSHVFLGALMSIYLASYEPGSRHTKRLASALDESRARLGRRWSLLLHNVPFLFDSRNAARTLGNAMYEMDDPWTGLAGLGFRDPHALGLLYHAHLAYVERMKPALRTASGVRRMLGWLAPSGGEARGTGAKEAIEALLGPWRSSKPMGEIRDQLTESLIAWYGDPRVRRDGVWLQVHSDYRDVLLKWLTGANIEFFLDVVSKVETSHMWQPRREFWWGLYKKGRIDAAWVAFSPNAAWTANQSEMDERKPKRLAYGKQTAKGSRRYTSLLILKIGRYIAVEGSHNYKVQVFRDSDPQAPRLFEEHYDCERIRLTPKHGEQAHHSGWQRRVLNLIRY